MTSLFLGGRGQKLRINSQNVAWREGSVKKEEKLVASSMDGKKYS
jgi:hypothetical protein